VSPALGGDAEADCEPEPVELAFPLPFPLPDADSDSDALIPTLPGSYSDSSDDEGHRVARHVLQSRNKR
jgi:hypothetical protein